MQLNEEIIDCHDCCKMVLIFFGACYRAVSYSLEIGNNETRFPPWRCADYKYLMVSSLSGV